MQDNQQITKKEQYNLNKLQKRLRRNAVSYTHLKDEPRKYCSEACAEKDQMAHEL